MPIHRSLRRLLPLALFAVLASTGVSARQATAPSPAADRHDGQHDFDFLRGRWSIHLKKLQHPLSGSRTWVAYEGTVVDRSAMSGHANVDEMDVENPATHERLQGLTLRLYDPATREWSLYWASAKTGTLGLPPNVGHFREGRGEFFDRETFQGRPIVVRYLWKDITANSAHFEQAFSTDDGKSWETNWITTQTRIAE